MEYFFGEMAIFQRDNIEIVLIKNKLSNVNLSISFQHWIQVFATGKSELMNYSRFDQSHNGILSNSDVRFHWNIY